MSRRRNAGGMSAADLFAASFGGTRANRLAEYDRAIARIDAEIALLGNASSLEEAKAMLSPPSEELP